MEAYHWAWLVVFVMVYVAKVPMFSAQAKIGYDNKHPRIQQQALPGLGHRSYAAHMNSFEALIGFTAALSSALWMNAEPGLIDCWAWVFAATRIVYVPLYWANIDRARSAVWFVGMAALLRLFLARLL